MLGAVWRFVKRHKKKFIATTAVFGGGYCAWRFLLPRVQQWMLMKLLNSAGGDSGMKELMKMMNEGGGGGEAGTATIDNGEAEFAANTVAKRQAEFEHKQLVSDKRVIESLESLGIRHHACFQVDECGRAVEKAQTKEEKLAALSALSEECLSRSISAAYVLHLSLLLHRIQVNILGREIAACHERGKDAGESLEDVEATHASFFSTTRHFQEERFQIIARSVREAVAACTKRKSLTAVKRVTAQDLSELASEVCAEVDAELMPGPPDGKRISLLLPDDIEGDATVKGFLDEARDYVESPQFLAVFQAVLKSGTQMLIDSLANTEDSPLRDGKAVPLAALNKSVMGLAVQAMDAQQDNTYIAKFAEHAAVVEFCQALYFFKAGDSKTV